MTDAELAAQGWTTRQMCYDDRFFLHYFRLMPDNRMLFGMRGGLFSSPRFDARMDRTIRAHFERCSRHGVMSRRRIAGTGLLSLAPDLTPYAGPIPDMPGAFTGLSYHGNGVAMGSYAGALLADLAMDRVPRHPYPQILRTPPRRWPLGRLAPRDALAALCACDAGRGLGGGLERTLKDREAAGRARIAAPFGDSAQGLAGINRPRHSLASCTRPAFQGHVRSQTPIPASGRAGLVAPDAKLPLAPDDDDPGQNDQRRPREHRPASAPRPKMKYPIPSAKRIEA